LNENFEPQNRKVFFIENFSGSFPHIFLDKKGIHLVTNSAQYSFQEKNLKFFHEDLTYQSSKIKNIFPGFYRPIKLNGSYGFYPINNGFALEDFGIKHQHSGFASRLVFRNVLAFNNHENINIYNGENFAYHFHNIKFSFMMPNEDGVEYQYFLENFSKKWSDWDEQKTVEFLDLREGNYTLLVKARKNGHLSEIATFNFAIKAPWYRTFWSYLASALLFMAIIYSLRKHQQNKLKKQKLALLKKEQNSLREQAERHREMMILEKQKQLEQEKNALKNEVKNKTIELATKAKEDEDKNRLLHILKEKIDEAEKNPSVSESRWKEMRRLLNTYLEIDDKTFEIQMDELHQEFFKVMKKRFPNLSIYDLRLCAYLRIGLTSKEMADILQVLPSSINVSRSRLRRKLNLLSEDDLYDFLINLQ
jgi:DNA-binding CsgD family transcriptional regulator